MPPVLRQQQVFSLKQEKETSQYIVWIYNPPVYASCIRKERIGGKEDSASIYQACSLIDTQAAQGWRNQCTREKRISENKPPTYIRIL